MSRSARSVWMKSFESVDGLPACPPDLSEPDYARLVFDNLCQVSDSQQFRAQATHTIIGMLYVSQHLDILGVAS